MIRTWLPVLLLFSLVIGGASVWVMSPHQKITHFELATPLKQVKESQLESVMKPYVGQSFWQIDLERLHAQIVRLDWVNDAEVKRIWPDGVEIFVEEQSPSVRWGNDALLNQTGEIFYPQNLKGFEDYPKLEGKEAQAAELLGVFQRIRQSIRPLGWSVTQVTQLGDESLKVEFQQAGVLILPSDNWAQKLQLFVRAYEQIPPDLRKSAMRYDLRYSNGFVIKRAPENAPNSQEHGL